MTHKHNTKTCQKNIQRDNMSKHKRNAIAPKLPTGKHSAQLRKHTIQNFGHIWKIEFPNSTLLQIRNYLFQRELSYSQYAWAKVQRYKTKVQYMNRSIISTIYIYIGDEVQTPCHLWMRYTHPAILNTQKQGRHRLENSRSFFFG